MAERTFLVCSAFSFTFFGVNGKKSQNFANNKGFRLLFVKISKLCKEIKRSGEMVDLASLKESSSIEERTIAFEVLTPMLMHSWQEVSVNQRGRVVSQPKFAEMRIPSLKGLLRYWWRSLQQEVSPQQLLTKEQALFGGTGSSSGKKSLVSLTIQPSMKSTAKAPICPHKRMAMSYAIEPKQQFSISLRVLKKDQQYFDLFMAYLRFMMMISGFGQRARRGAGAVQMVDQKWKTKQDFQHELQEVLRLLKKDHLFEFPNHSSCLLKSKKKAGNVPMLCHVWIGKSFKKPLDARLFISEAGHVANPGRQTQFLGNIGTRDNKRQASPYDAC